MKETLQQAGYTYGRYDARWRLHLLCNDQGDGEWWAANKYHASYGLIYKNTHLEFVRSATPQEWVAPT